MRCSDYIITGCNNLLTDEVAKTYCRDIEKQQQPNRERTHQTVTTPDKRQTKGFNQTSVTPTDTTDEAETIWFQLLYTQALSPVYRAGFHIVRFYNTG